MIDSIDWHITIISIQSHWGRRAIPQSVYWAGTIVLGSSLLWMGPWFFLRGFEGSPHYWSIIETKTSIFTLTFDQMTWKSRDHYFINAAFVQINVIIRQRGQKILSDNLWDKDLQFDLDTETGIFLSKRTTTVLCFVTSQKVLSTKQAVWP